MLTRKPVDSQPATLPVPRPAVARTLFLGVCVAVAYATLLPFHFTFERVLAGEIALPRLVEPSRSPTLLWDFFGNVALFLPVGAFAWMGLQRGRRRREALWRAALAGATFSFVIEVLQCFTPTRTPAVSDVLANGLGSLLGALAARVTWPRLRSFPGMTALVRSSRREPLFMALVGLVILVSVQAVLPFDNSLVPHVVRRGLRMAQIDPRADPAPFLDTSRMLLFALLGGVTLRVTQLLTRRSSRACIGTSLGLVTALALVLEAVQIVCKSQVLALQDAVGSIVSGVLGIVAALLVKRGATARHVWSTVTLVYGLALLLVTTGALGPSGVEILRLRLQVLLPIYAAYFGETLADVSQFTEVLLLFVPFGFLLAGECGRRRRQLSGNAPWVTLVCVSWAALRHFLLAGVTQGLGAFSWSVAAALGGLVGSTSWLWFEAARVATRTEQNGVAPLRRIA